LKIMIKLLTILVFGLKTDNLLFLKNITKVYTPDPNAINMNST